MAALDHPLQGRFPFFRFGDQTAAVNFHPEYALAVFVGLFKHRHNFFRGIVHIGALVVDAAENHLHPGILAGRFERVEVVAGDADGFDHAFVDGRSQVVPLLLQPRRPVAGGHTVQEHDIDVIGAQFFSESIQRLRYRRRCQPFIGLGPDLAHDHHFIARYFFQQLANKDVRAIDVGAVEKGDAAIVELSGQLDKRVGADAGLIGNQLPATGAGAEGQFGYVQSRFAQRHRLDLEHLLIGGEAAVHHQAGHAGGRSLHELTS